jgi:hypothetical protein
MENLFNQYADIPALEKETGRVLELLGQVKKGLLDLSKLGIKIDTAKGMTELNAQAKEYEALQKRIAEAQKQVIEQEQRLTQLNKQLADSMKGQNSGASQSFGAMNVNIQKQIDLTNKLKSVRADIKKLDEFSGSAGSSPQLTAELNGLKQSEATLKAELSDVNRFIRNQAKEFISAGDSVDGMKARLAQMLQQWDAMDNAFKSSEGGQALKKQIDDLTKALDTELTGTGRFQQRVGNYQGSAKIIVDALKDVETELSNLKSKEQGLQNLSARDPIGFKMQGQDKELAKVTAQIGFLTTEATALNTVTASPKFLNVAGKVGDITAETKVFTLALAQLEEQGLKNSEVYDQIQERLAHLTDLMGDTREEIKALSSESRGFDLFASAIGTVSAAFQVAASAAEVLGDNNQDVQKSIQRLMAIQNIANGIRQVAVDLTTRGTAANKAYVFVQNLVATATNASTAATERLMAVLKGVGIIALVSILIYAADKMNLFGNKTKDAEKEVEALNKALERQNQILDENIKKIDNATQLAINKLKERQAVENAAKESEYLGMTEFQAAMARRGKAYEDDSKIRAQTIVGIIKENNLRREHITVLTNQISKLGMLYGLELNSAENVSAALYEAETRGQKTEAAQLKQLLDLRKGYEDGQNQITLINSQGIDTRAQKELDDAKARSDRQRKYIENEKKYSVELTKLRLNSAADFQAAIKNLEIPGMSEDAAKQEFNLRKRAIEVQRDLDLKQEDITVSQRKSIIFKADQDISALESQLGIDIIKIRADWQNEGIQQAKEYADQTEQAEKDRIQRIKDIDEGLLEHATDRAGKDAAEQKQVADEKFRQGLYTQAQYDAELERIDMESHRRVLQHQIEFYESQIKIIKAAGGDTLAMEKGLAEAREQLSEIGNSATDKTIDNIKKEKDAIKSLKESYVELGRSLFDTFTTVIGGSYDAVKNKIQEQIDSLDVLKDRQIQQVNESGDSEEKKAARIALINAKAQADKEALERRQRQIDRQRAIFDRAAKAFQITTDTIVNVNKIRVEAAAAVNPVIKAALFAQSFIAAAVGAANLIALLAIPIPKYFMGGKARKGLGIVADEGRELVEEKKSGRVRLFTQPTLINFVGDDEVIHSNRVTEQILRKTGFQDHVRNGGSVMVNVDNKEVVNELKKQNKKPPLTIVVTEKLEATAYWHNQIKY